MSGPAFIDALRASTAGSAEAVALLERIAEGERDGAKSAQSEVAQLAGDAAQAHALAGALGVPLWTSAAAFQMLRAGQIQRPGGDLAGLADLLVVAGPKPPTRD